MGEGAEHRSGGRLLRLATGWIVATAGAAAAVALAAELAAPTWPMAGFAVAVVVVATVLAGATPGLVAAAVTSLLAWRWLEGRVPSSTELVVAIAVGGSTLALLVAAMRELQDREHTRRRWLDRLSQLTEELGGASSALAPLELVEDAARRASGAEEVVVLRHAVGDAAPVEPGDVPGDTGVRQVASTATPPITLRFRLPHPPPEALAAEFDAFLRSIADQCASALERADLLRAEAQARDDLVLLARSWAALSASLDVARVASTIEELLVPQLADVCKLTVEAEDAPHHDDPPAGTTLVPLRYDGELIGHLELQRLGRPLSQPEENAALLVAEPAGRALGHALQFTAQVRTASTLMHSMLPEAVLGVPNLEVATRYLAASEGHAAGGDFYDVLRVGARAVLIVGDVQGKGVEAAALTSAARHTLRTAALGGAGPAAMLHQLNRALLYGHAERMEATGQPVVRFVTASVVSLTPTPEGFEARFASGGHPPPLLARTGGVVEPLLAEGPLLGVFEGCCYEERSTALQLSDLLVLYTDGVIEQRQQPDLFDETQLGRLVRNMLRSRHAEDVAQQILDTVLVVSPREARDDIALVVARVTGPRSWGGS